MKKYVVMRKPVLPEDEGKAFFMKVVDSKEAAEEYIKEHCLGFFSRRDYMVAEVDE